MRTGRILTRRAWMGVALACAIGLTFAGAQGQAPEKLKIGILTTLSGPPAVIGTQQKNGFQLAVKTLASRLGGREVELIVQDEELKPDVAVAIVRIFHKRPAEETESLATFVMTKDGDKWQVVSYQATRLQNAPKEK